MKKILLAIDDTDACKRAAEYVLKMFGADPDCSITLIHAKPEIMLYGEVALASYDEIELKENMRVKNLVEYFTALFTNSGVNPYVIIKNGEPVDMVLDEARDYNLLVIGKSENSLLNKIFSSNQDGFLEKAPIPVLIVQ